MKTKHQETKKIYRVVRGIENNVARFEAGQEVSEAELLAAFPAETIARWVQRGILEVAR